VIAGLLLALAQGQTLLDGCGNHAPVAGTAGYTNARNAVRTTVSTYGAGAFARRRLRKNTGFVMDMHAVYNVARVPHTCDFGESAFDGTYYMQPFDVAATNMGLRLPLLSKGPANSSLRAFYASSVVTGTTWAGPALAAVPMFNLYPAFAAPVVGRGNAYVGISAYTVDWIGGAAFRSDVVSFQAGYTGNRGLYLDITQDRYGLFTNGIVQEIVRDGFTADNLAYLMGGIQHLDHAEAFGLDEKVGRTSLFARTLPQERQDEGEEDVPDAEKAKPLRTVHLAQDSLWEQWDVNLTGQLLGGARLREAGVAFHSEGWHIRSGGKDLEGSKFFVRAGVVSLPPQPLFGVDGGLLPSLKAEYVKRLDDRELKLSAYLNEPEVLDLYPYAYNAFAVNAEITFFLEAL
jgi:hypothetical protein